MRSFYEGSRYMTSIWVQTTPVVPTASDMQCLRQFILSSLTVTYRMMQVTREVHSNRWHYQYQWQIEIGGRIWYHGIRCLHLKKLNVHYMCNFFMQRFRFSLQLNGEILQVSIKPCNAPVDTGYFVLKNWFAFFSAYISGHLFIW